MKKILLFIIISIFAFSLVACEASSTSSSTSSDSQTTSNSTQENNLYPVSATFFADKVDRKLVQGQAMSYANLAANVVYSDGQTYLFRHTDLTIDNGGLDVNVPGVYHHVVTFYNLPEKLEFDVTVIKKAVETAGVVNINVDSNYTGVNGDYDSNNYSCFNNVSDALLVLANGGFSAESQKNVYIKQGTYKEKLNIPSTLKNVHLIGEGTDASKTVLTYDDCSTKAGGTDASASITIKGEGFWAKNITFENSYDYNNGTEAAKQAVAALVEADKVVFDNCVFLGYQDTLEAKGGRQYYKDCRIEGCVDYIFGNNSTALFDSCEIKTRKRTSSNEYCITAQKGIAKGNDTPTYGYVFLGCRLTAEDGVIDGSTALGRPWRGSATVTWLNCEMASNISKLAYGESGITRYRSMTGDGLHEPQDAFFTEYNNTGAGAITEAVYGCTMLTASQAQEYTFANIFATTNGQVTYTGEFDAEATLTALRAL